MTSFSQAVAELEGKLYGNKTLKLEPGAYQKIPLFLPTDEQCANLTKAYNSVDKLLRKDDCEAASIEASLYIYGLIFGPVHAVEMDRKFRTIRNKAKSHRMSD